MHLLALLQLQAVFEMAKKGICRVQLVEIVSADVALVVEFLQREKCPTGTQPGFAASIYSLQALDKKFDVPNSAAINLHVEGFMSFGRGLATPLTFNLFARDQRCFNGRKVDFCAIDLRLDPADEGARQLHVSSRVPDLYERLTLPVVGCLGIIPQRVGKADSEFALVALRPQAKIYAEHRAFAGMPGEDFRN